MHWRICSYTPWVQRACLELQGHTMQACSTLAAVSGCLTRRKVPCMQQTTCEGVSAALRIPSMFVLLERHAGPLVSQTGWAGSAP